MTANHVAPDRPLFPTRARRLVITGASSGLGRGLAINYAAPGVSLGLIGRNKPRLDEAAEACRALGAQVETAVIDVADAAAMQAWLTDFDVRGPVELLIANAGMGGGPQDSRSLDGLEQAALLIRTNLLGVVHAVESLAPAMIERGTGQIAVIASTAAYRGLPYMPAYAASKAGVRTYGEALRAQLAPLGVRVSVVVPSFFDSPMTDRFHGPKPMVLNAQAAVERVRRGLDRAQARIVFPRRIGLLMQALDLIPASWGDALLRRDPARVDAPD